MGKGFGELFSESWKEYKKNFWFFFVLLLVCLLIPSIISYFIGLNLGIGIARLGAQPSFKQVMGFLSQNTATLFWAILFGIIAFLLSIFAYLTIICGCFTKKKFDIQQSISGAKKNFWRYLWFSIVVFIFLAILFILLVIPGIIFLVFWIFCSYVFISEKKGIIGSLKESKKLVNGKWWLTFGYFLLLFLIFFAVSFILSFASGIIMNIFGLPAFNLKLSLDSYYAGGGYVVDVVGVIVNFVTSLFMIPIAILFGKNLYLDRKKRHE